MLTGMVALLPTLMSYKLRLIPNYIAKQRILSHFFKGMNEKQFQQTAQEYSLTEIDKILRPKAMERITWHQDQEHKVVVSRPQLNAGCNHGVIIMV
jgi:phosphoserine phosphatase